MTRGIQQTNEGLRAGAKLSWPDVLVRVAAMLFFPQLRVKADDGHSINDYRVRDGKVELRIFSAQGETFSDTSGCWKPLTTDELLLHLNLRTPVAAWLERRYRRMQD